MRKTMKWEMTNEKWEMGKTIKWEMRNEKWEMGKTIKWEIRNEKWEMGNGKWETKKRVPSLFREIGP